MVWHVIDVTVYRWILASLLSLIDLTCLSPIYLMHGLVPYRLPVCRVRQVLVRRTAARHHGVQQSQDEVPETTDSQTKEQVNGSVRQQIEPLLTDNV